MARSKHTRRLCFIVTLAMFIVTCFILLFESAGIISAKPTQPLYVDNLFELDKVHTVDIIINDNAWQELLAKAPKEEYISADVVINGKLIKNIGIRAKGNSSLVNVFTSPSNRYSFKLELDHFETGKNYYGLDKLSLNNMVQDNTYMKDYVAYRYMRQMGVYTPLCSFAYITVNGEEWGLYLAVEDIEESFAQRNFGVDYGHIYKPDLPPIPIDIYAAPEPPPPAGEEPAPRTPNFDWMIPFVDIGLIYRGDEYSSYASIFSNAIFSPVNSDKDRLIAAIKKLNIGDVENTVNIDEVICYFVVHNFVLNPDSYTGNLMHNYYLYEKDGILSMIAWDYNLAFGGMSVTYGRITEPGEENISPEAAFFQEGQSATMIVNYPIDNPLFGGTWETRPMISWIFSNKRYLDQYHTTFEEFIELFNYDFESFFDKTIAMIDPYVKKDPTGFCTYDDFLAASAALKEVCLLRAESVKKQLKGILPSTVEGQLMDSSAYIDASNIDLNIMGHNHMKIINR
jgi:hypothetical protein